MADRLHELLALHEKKRKGAADTPDDEIKSLSTRLSGYINKLTPPAGTVWCKQQSDTVFDNERMDIMLYGTEATPFEFLTWRTDVYVYVSGARFDDVQFQDHGGSIIIVLVHSGQASFTVTEDYLEYVYAVKGGGLVTPNKQLPTTDSGVRTSSGLDYTIGYEEGMSLFRNGGNQPFDFDAIYQDGLTRYSSKQTGSTTSEDVEFSIRYDTELVDIKTSLFGLSVFKTSDPNIFPITLTCEASIYNHRDLGDFMPQGTVSSKTQTITIDIPKL